MMKKRDLSKLTHSVKWQGTYKKFKYTVMLYMIIPIIILNAVIITSYSKSLNSELQEKIDLAYNQISADVVSYFTDIERSYNYIVNNDRLRLFVASGDLEKDEGYRIKIEVRRVMKVSEHLSGFELFSIIGDYATNGTGGGYPSKVLEKPVWYTKYIESGEIEHIYDDEKYLYVTKPIDMYGQDVGIMILKYYKYDFEEKLNIEKYGCDLALRLYSPEDDIVFSVGDTKPAKIMSFDVNSSHSRLDILIGNKDNEEIRSKVISYSAICLCTCLVLAYVISSICAKFLYKGVSNVITKMETDLKSAKNDENDSAVENDIETELAKSLNKLHNTQFTALQMQINPHFIFNVLNYVNVLALQEESTDEDVVYVVNLLADILRYAMQDPKYLTKLSEEIEIAKKYMELEQIEASKKFDVVWNIEPAALERDCIKMFLQPIIENAVMHGVKSQWERKGVIKISAKCKGSDVILTVEDNGNGISQDKLEEIRQRLNEPYVDYSKHIGMRNVNERIKLMYGEGYGLTIDSDSSGTKVTIKIGSKSNTLS